MANEKLTAKQEKFVQNIVKGMSHREAYRKSYSVKNMSEKAIDSEASKLFNYPKITLRYLELMKRVEKSTIMTAQERLEYLTGIVRETHQEKTTVIEKGKKITLEYPADLNTKIKAIDTMNKMQGDYTTKIEGELKVSKLEDLI